jgi:hypothetical protein
MGAKAAVFMVVIVVMLVSRVGDSQWQQGKRQSEQQTTHGESPKG